ncbi:MAG TPA: orotate phosphoribosyltransferase [Acidimicrobiales bacterium]|nr:orotate phosphoribosyltransferase [Acidimicrobiales bacterium]
MAEPAAAQQGAGSLREVPLETWAALRDHLLAHAVRRGEFILKSGRRSSWFLDAKQTACRPDGMLLVAQAVLAVMPAEATAIGGLTMGADPVAFCTAAVAATRGRPLKAFSVRKEVKDHGGGGRIAGALDAGDRVVITEDAVTRGTSPLEALEVVRRAGAVAVMVVAVVDRGGTCAAMAEAQGVPFRALVTAADLGFDPGS